MTLRRQGSPGWGETPPEYVEERIIIQPDGMIVVFSGKVEYGQGIRTGFAKIVAEELSVPLDRVKVVLGETDCVPWDMGTFGSMSTAVDGRSLRLAAVQARKLLVSRAAKHLGADPGKLKLANGMVIAPDGREIPFEILVRNAPLTGTVPDFQSVVQPISGALPEDRPFRIEGMEIVTGQRRYPADIRLPGMLYGRVMHGPTPGANIVHYDEEAMRAIPGVVDVVKGEDFVGVVARRTGPIIAAMKASRAEWRYPATHRDVSPDGKIPSVEITIREDPGVDARLSVAKLRLKAQYHTPHIAHAALGPSAAVADVREDGADLYAATQRPFGLRDEASEILGIAPEKINVHPQAMGGMFGRGSMNDASRDAIRLSRAVKRPVLVQWSREEEFRLSPHRPLLDAKMEAGLDENGRIIAWSYFTQTNPHTYGSGFGNPRLLEMTSGRNAVPPYSIGSYNIQLRVERGEIRTGAFRSLAAAPNVFAIESFMDELAQLAKKDPIDFRLEHLDDHRLRRVLETVRERSGWKNRLREAGRGYGVACAIYHGTYVAEVACAKVAVSAGGAKAIRLERVWCAVDPGRLVHPDGARNQIEGGIQQAASWTLLEELRIQNGEVKTDTWRDYPIATFRDAPLSIDVVFTPEEGAESTGIGEPGSVPTAAAIANAVYDATGVRARRLPIFS